MMNADGPEGDGVKDGGETVSVQMPPRDDESLKRLARELFMDSQQTRQWINAVGQRDLSVLRACIDAAIGKKK